uniref:sensor histidine kinase n=1 Tax=uncultured Draconibacterium sp. TaxID=1573823 RepID=UPI003217E121
MSAKVRLLFRRRVLLLIIALTAIACGALVYTTIKSLTLDKEHLELIEHTKNIDIEISHSRIYLDDYFLYNDTLKGLAVLNSFNSSKQYIAQLDSFIVKQFKGTQEFNLLKSLSLVKTQVEQLNLKIIRGLENEINAIDVVILDNYHDFQTAYQELDKNVHEYILDASFQFKKEIFKLVFAIFCLLVICVFLIYRLTYAYNEVEKQQAIKSMEIEYKERKRIAADLHDGLGSILSSIALFIKLIEKDCTNQAIHNNLLKVKELSSIALENLESAINNLNPSVLNRYGLVKALEIVCDKITDLGEITCKVNAAADDFKCDPNIKINIYRICNELINNTIKHSEATELSIDIRKVRKTMVLVYRDNGKGFNPNLIFSSDENKMGLRNIINRIESMRGKYEINSSEGRGVEITIQFTV